MAKNSCDYEARYVDHAPGEDFTKARSRRVRLFKKVTGLEVIPRSCKRTRSIDKMYDYFRWTPGTNVRLDHVSFWCLGPIPFLMTEPYDCGRSQLIHPDYVGIKIPKALSLYCGSWPSPSSDEPGTDSYLYTPKRYVEVLVDIEVTLEKAAEQAPPWYSL
jgi:hypothetical protein